MPRLKLLHFQFRRLIQIYAPEICLALHSKEIPDEVFTIQWYISLFSYDFDNENLEKLWNLFLLLKWKFLLQLSIVILKKMRFKIQELPHNKLVTYLRSGLINNLFDKVILL